MEFDPIAFRDFIRIKFAEWRGIGRESLADFADYLGISQQVLSNWYNGKLKRTPDVGTYNLLIAKYGNEVYDVLGISSPEPTALKEMIRDLKELSSAIKSIKENNGTENASPEDLEKINSILSNFSSKYQEIDGFWEIKKE
jgi:transcriptional regulator with XRE-family HTH domain